MAGVEPMKWLKNKQKNKKHTCRRLLRSYRLPSPLLSSFRPPFAASAVACQRYVHRCLRRRARESDVGADLSSATVLVMSSTNEAVAPCSILDVAVSRTGCLGVADNVRRLPSEMERSRLGLRSVRIYCNEEPGPDMDPVLWGAGTEAGSSHHEGEIVRLPLPSPLEFFLRRRWSFCAAVGVFGAAAVAAAVSAPPPSPDLRRRQICAVALLQPPPSPVLPSSSPDLRRDCAAVTAPLPSSRLLVMAEEIIPKTDMAIDAGIASKSENLPVQVTPIRLTKDNYLSWSAALEIGITSRGRLLYITGDKPAPSKTDPQWANWALEDSQVKVWIISSVSADIQPLILRKPTSFEMWNVLARMYGRKKRVLRTYQIKRNIYALKQGDMSVASYYAALKTKWEELDYHVEDNWDCGSDHARHWEMEWMDRTFLFLGGLRDEFETIRSQILNCDDISGIEDVYARVESEEQRRQVMQIDPSRESGPSAFVSRSSVPSQRPARRCTHCHKLGHSADFC
ncbi:hypothetical protein EJ110_NYTH31422 [Nymphaea thermarum]|nr:hypothetical protein EJ110_NYTH31422 [Nymphaea thermarum]